MTKPLEHLLIRASAGTGKTFQLSNRYISLLASGVRPTSILATTFTRKAAGEIRDRILKRLAEALLRPNAASELFGHLQIPADMTPLDFEQCFTSMVNDLHQLNIGTLDSFFSVWATKLSLEFGLTPSWSMLNKTEYETLVQLAISKVIQNEKRADLTRLLRLLNKGKIKRSVTTNLTDAINQIRALFLQSEKSAWTSPLAATRPSEEEYANGLDALELAIKGQPAAIGKGIAVDLALLRQEQYHNAITKGLVKKVIEGATHYRRVEIPAAVTSLYQPILDYLRAHFSREVQDQAAATYELLERFTIAFEQLKRNAGRLEFSDATMLAARVSDLPPALTQRLNSDISHVLLDEFQDTSIPQWQAIQHLVEEVTAEEGSPAHSLLCVGDTKQAIYGWRGGRREIFSTLSDTVNALKTVHLKESYRSSTVVLDFVNLIFENLTNHPRLGNLAPIIEQWTNDFISHTAAYDLDGYVEYRNAEAGDSTDGRLQKCLAATVQQILALLETGKPMSIGVLLRKNDHIGKLIQMLGEAGVEASEEGGNSLRRFHPIQLVCTWLHLLEFPDDSLALFRIFHSPLRSLLNADQIPSRLSQSVVLSQRHRLLSLGLGEYLDGLTNLLMPYLTASQHSRIQQLIQHADTFEAIDPLRLIEFLQSLETERFLEEKNTRVRVMTIHASKGLEFDAVILPHLETQLKISPGFVVSRNSDQLPNQIFPYRNEDLQAILPPGYRDAATETTTEQIQETLCVLYVAFTRAARALYLIGPAQPSPPRDVPKTLAGLIQMAITSEYNSVPNELIYKAGQADWYQSLESEPLTIDSRPTLPEGLNRSASNTAGTLPTASPSSLEGGEFVLAGGLLRSINQDALDFGNLTHQLFEQITWWDEVEPDSYLQMLTDKRIAWGDSLKSLLQQFSQLPDVNQVLTPDFYQAIPTFSGTDDLVVKVELPLTAIIEDKLIRGFADRIVLGLKNGQIVAADIIDFKTDALGDNHEQLDEKIMYYRPQLAAYQSTVAQMFRIPESQVTTRLLFVTAGLHAPVTTSDQ